MNYDSKSFFRETILFNWDMLLSNPNYYLTLNSITTYQKIEELYDMLIYFMEIENYEACNIIQDQLSKIKIIYQKGIVSHKK